MQRCFVWILKIPIIWFFSENITKSRVCLTIEEIQYSSWRGIFWEIPFLLTHEDNTIYMYPLYNICNMFFYIYQRLSCNLTLQSALIFCITLANQTLKGTEERGISTIQWCSFNLHFCCSLQILPQLVNISQKYII